MKNKEAANRLGWKAEWIKEGEEEMVKSLYILFNRIKTENQIPKKQQLTTVKSVHKGGVKENIQENKKGIFPGLGMTSGQQPAPVLSPAQIKKKKPQAGDEKPAHRESCMG